MRRSRWLRVAVAVLALGAVGAPAPSLQTARRWSPSTTPTGRRSSASTSPAARSARSPAPPGSPSQPHPPTGASPPSAHKATGPASSVIVPEGSSTPTVLANVPYGLNWHPSWTRDDQVVFVHRDDLAPPTTGPWPREPLEAPTATTTSIPSPRTSTRGATLHLDHVTARRIGLIVRPCPGCGSLDVSLAGHDLGRISTSARSTHYRQLRWLPTTTSYTGTLTIRTTSTAPDYIDGFLSTR